MTQATIDGITDRVLVESLRSTKCPACGGVKKTWQTFCGKDYFRLPHTLRRSLYDLLGSGYKEAVVEAMNYLNDLARVRAIAIAGFAMKS